MDSVPQDLLARFSQSGQAHVFRFWQRLDAGERAGLVEQLSAVDLPLIDDLRARFVDAPETTSERRLEPTEVIELSRDSADREARRRLGADALSAGRVGCVTVAGGQGTRLGFEGPKGAFPLGPVSGITLFDLFARKLRAVEQRHGVRMPWLIMTSPDNHAQTVDLFDANDRFGVSEEQLRFFTQGTLPALDEAGLLVLERRDRLFCSPDGHGGTVTALASSGLMDELASRGVTQLFYFQVDNPLIVLADPLFIGEHLHAGAEMSTKVVRKTDPEEKVGVVGRIDGRVGVIEYSDLDPAQQAAREPDGSLRFWAGNIAVHCFDVAFLQRLAADPLPIHRAGKPVPKLDDAGDPAGQTDGYKFERFIFDGLPRAARTMTMEVIREAEFAPVKNAAGTDSVDAARRLLQNDWGRWLEAAGVQVPRDETGDVSVAVEICPEFADSAVALAGRLDASLTIDGPLWLR